MTIFCGGLTQLLASMWEFCRMNAFAVSGSSAFLGVAQFVVPMLVVSFLAYRV
jgi:succinate-acetate transporter protein